VPAGAEGISFWDPDTRLEIAEIIRGKEYDHEGKLVIPMLQESNW
jgi:hypothetical protein